jgi:hypothetical protein
MRQWIYGFGCPGGHEDVYKKRYESHNKNVIEYFRDRPDDLLILDLASGDGWEQMCPFLGKSVLDVPFPHAKPQPNLSQEEFAAALCISVKTVRNWQHGCREPSGPAMRLLQIAAKHPEVLLEAA